MYAEGTLIATLMASKSVTVRINDVTTRLSPKEAAATVAIAELGLAVMGGSTASCLHDDNMSWFEQSDLVDVLGIGTMAARGLMTFLRRKGIAMDNGGRTKEITATWCLQEHGINVAQALMGGKHNNVGDYVFNIDVHGTANGG
jgi:hypothetical protein